jgi:hypothetical protein
MATYKHLRSSTANKRPTTSITDGQLAINTNTASPGLFFKDSAGTGIVKVGPVHVGTTAPNATPAAGGSSGNYLGEQWLDTSVSPAQMKVWNGSAWVGIVADELPVSKLQDGDARQLLQTDAAGTGVEWTSNVDVPGTLDVTSTATFDSIARHPLGSAAAPTLTFTGDTNTGIYSPGADQVAVATNGTGRLFVDASGRVGIGNSSPGSLLTARSTSSPTISIENNSSAGSGVVLFRSGGTNYGLQDRINIKGLITDSATGATALTVETSAGDLASPAERLRITSAGLVGIGTSAPQATLHANGAILSSGALVALSASNIFFDQPTSALSRIGVVGANTSTAGALRISQYSSDGSVGRDVFSIDDQGRVGIGTTSPQSKFVVSNGGADGLEFTTNSDQAIVSYNRSTSAYAPIGLQGSQIVFSAPTERARIDSSGRLLVGTSSGRAVGFSSLQAPVQVETTTAAAYTAVNNTNDANGCYVSIAKTRGTSAGAVTAVQNNDELGAIRISGSDGTGFVVGAQIIAAVDGTPGTNDLPTRLVFSTTADGASSPTERMRINNSGNVGIGNAYIGTAVRLVTKGNGTSSSGYAFEAQDSGENTLLYCRNDGYINTGTRAVSPYNNTTASAANVNLFSDGGLYRSTSSIRYKTDVETIENQYSDALLECRPVWYKSLCAGDNKEWGYWGFIAEEVAQIDPRLCFFKEEEGGTLEPEGVQYDRFVPHLLNLIKRQKEQIEAMEARLSALESA